MYTWGSNDYNCLGRPIDDGSRFDPVPGLFEFREDGVFKGGICAVACGRYFTLVATLPYDGPNQEELRQMAEKEAIEAAKRAKENTERIQEEEARRLAEYRRKQEEAKRETFSERAKNPIEDSKDE